MSKDKFDALEDILDSIIDFIRQQDKYNKHIMSQIEAIMKIINSCNKESLVIEGDLEQRLHEVEKFLSSDVNPRFKVTQ